MKTLSAIKPNSKLEKETGYPYAMFYLSTQVENILIDFENPGHISLINLLADQEREIKNESELSSASISKGKRLFKKVLGENVSYSKYSGADCTFRLSKTPDNEISSENVNSRNKIFLRSIIPISSNTKIVMQDFL